MKAFYEIKNISDSVKDVDTTSRRVKVVISKMGNKDLDNEVIDMGAYTKTISERGPSGSNLIWHLTDHNPNLKSAVGKFSELYVDGTDLVGVTNIPNTTWGNDVLEFYKTGHINQHSIGFRTIKSEPVNAGKADEYRLIKEVLLYEGSAVLWGANPMTPTLSAGKSLTKEEAATELVKVNDELNQLLTTYRKAKLTDESYELIEMQISQKQETIKSLLNNYTQPAEAVEPEEKRDWSIIKTLIN